MSSWLRPLSLFIIVLAVTTGRADEIDLRPTPADLTVQVVDAASGAPVTADRVLVRAVGALLDTVAESRQVRGTVTFEDVMVLKPRSYIVSAWVEGVGYHVRHSGQEFVNGQPAVVNAFEQTNSTDGLTVSGMNLVVRRRDRGYGIEAIVTVDNQSRPQRTVRADALPVRLSLPAGIEQMTVEVDDGPEPFGADLRPAGGLTGVAAAIAPGQAQITIRGFVVADSELEFSAACNLPVAAWSLMTWPADLRIDSFDLQEDREQDYGGFGRWRGRALDPGQAVDIRVVSSQPTTATPVFSDSPAPQDAPSDAPVGSDRSIPWVTIIAAAVLLSAYAVWRLRR